MPGPDRQPIELKRQVRQLLALDGRVPCLSGGPWLLGQGRLVDAPGGAGLKLAPAAFARLAGARQPTLVALSAVLEQ